MINSERSDGSIVLMARDEEMGSPSKHPTTPNHTYIMRMIPGGRYHRDMQRR